MMLWLKAGDLWFVSVEDLMTIFFPNRPEAQLNSWRLGGRESLVIGQKTRAFYRV